MTYTIVTIANKIPQEPYYTFHEHFRSLKGEVPLVLGVNAGEYRGLGSKPRLLYAAIKENKIKTTHLIFNDCFDLVYAVKPSELFEKYLLFKSPFVISAEKNCFPADLKKEYDELGEDFESPYKYLNSGMIVAEVPAMLSVLDSMDAKNIPNDYWSEENNCMINPNDQEYYQQEFLKQPVPMILDRFQILCNTLHDVKKEDLDFTYGGTGIYNKETNTFPCSFHLNGSSKTEGLREPVLQKLNFL